MGLETGSYIDNLVITNPIGGTDLLSGADDHLRLLKTVLKNSFPTQNFPIASLAMGGAADAYTATLSPVPAALVTFMSITLSVTAANLTTTPTLNVNVLGAKTIKHLDGTALRAGDIVVGLNTFIYNGTDFLLATNAFNPAAPGAIGATTPAPGTFTSLTASGAVTLGDNAADVLTATTDKIVSSLAGGINLPLQSSFAAYLSSSQTDKTGDGTAYTIICNTEVYDQNADYDNATGIFTAPVTGRYLFTGAVRLSGMTICTGVDLKVVASNRTLIIGSMSQAASAVGPAASGSCIMDMDAADTAILTVTAFGEASAVGDVTASEYTYFSGQLIA